jgi:hypothetical protein
VGRRVHVGPDAGPASAFCRCTLAGVRGPACVFSGRPNTARSVAQRWLCAPPFRGGPILFVDDDRANVEDVTSRCAGVARARSH